LNQVEFHPYLQQPELVQYCKEHGIGMASYGGLVPLSTKTDGPVNDVVNSLAAKYGVSDSAVLVKWNLSKCKVTVTTSSKEERLKALLENERNDAAVPLTAEDIKAIDEAGAKLRHRQFWDKNFAN
jgi:diketogulonate reductase-like aldo/keto reductase